MLGKKRSGYPFFLIFAWCFVKLKMMGKQSQMVEQIPFKSGVVEPEAPTPGSTET